MVLPSAWLLTSDVLNSCQNQPLNPQGVKGKNDLHRSLCQEILLTCFTTLELMVFTKKQCGCDSQGHVSFPCRCPRTGSRSRVSFPRGPGGRGGGQSLRRVSVPCFLLPPSPVGFAPLFLCFLEFLLGNKYLLKKKNNFFCIHFIQKTSDGFLYPLYLDHQGGTRW